MIGRVREEPGTNDEQTSFGHFSERDYAVIMAGGSGSRLWPLSRKTKPKQFQELLGKKSFLQMMYEMLASFLPVEQIFIQTTSDYVHWVEKQLPAGAGGQIIVEPETRDTAPAFAFAAASMLARNPEACLGIFYSDNIVESASIDLFKKSLEIGFAAAKQHANELIVIGVAPQYPHTGLGYIGVGEGVGLKGANERVNRVDSFVEKPNIATAKSLIESDRFVWNTGYKIAKASAIIELLCQAHDIYRRTLPLLIEAVSDKQYQKFDELFKRLPKVSFEYLVSEQAKRMFVIVADIGWSDAGDWEIVSRILSQGSRERTAVSGRVIESDCENTLIIAKHRPVVVVGLSNVVVVETEDSVLVMSTERSQDMKSILKRLRPIAPEVF